MSLEELKEMEHCIKILVTDGQRLEWEVSLTRREAKDIIFSLQRQLEQNFQYEINVKRNS